MLDTLVIPLLPFKDLDAWREKLGVGKLELCEQAEVHRATYTADRSEKWTIPTYRKFYGVLNAQQVSLAGKHD